MTVTFHDGIASIVGTTVTNLIREKARSGLSLYTTSNKSLAWHRSELLCTAMLFSHSPLRQVSFRLIWCATACQPHSLVALE